MKAPLHACLFIVACLFAQSCSWQRSSAHEAREFSRYHEPAIHSASRVVLMPVFLDSGIGTSARSMDHSLIRALTELNHFEILQASIADRDQLFPEDPLRSNRLSQDSLRHTRDTFGADAVILARINHWQSFDPVALSITIAMVDCRNGSVLWTASGMWDSALRNTQDDIKEWFQHRRGSGNVPLGGWRSVLSSPSVFSRYVSDRLAASVLSPPDGHR
ncbi:MAG: hypothetical protein EA402_01890 [Planctomycetota bacterium]|nr:MAG: hypothetical protein EA402_01890 [Planctomycetota bacterium]